MKTKITELLNIEYPIFQGGMAWVSDASLASAVSNAGGLGIIAAGNAPASWVEAEIKKTKSLTDKPFGVNIMLMSPFAAEVAVVCVRERVKAVITGAGDPSKYMAAFLEAGIFVIPVVPSTASAKRMERVGARAVIAEGLEAGGHIGKLTTMAMTPQIVDAVSIPVMAAGGIGDGRGMAAAFMLGAEGVQIGTRFLLAAECTVHENYKNAVIKAKDIDTTTTGQITGHPVRVLKNSLSRVFEAVEREEMQKDAPDIGRIEELGSGGLRLAVKDGDVENGSVMAGQIAGLCKKLETAKEIIDSLVKECSEAISLGGRLW